MLWPSGLDAHGRARDEAALETKQGNWATGVGRGSSTGGRWQVAG